MKKRLLLVCWLLFGISLNILWAQSAAQPAAATWQLTSSATVSSSTTGSVTATAQERGALFPAPTYNNRTIAGTSTSVSTQNYTVNPGGVGTSSETAHANGGYVEFAVTPQAGYVFNVETISFYMGAGNANSNGTSVEYSLNSDFSSPVVLGTPGGTSTFLARDVLYPFSFSPSGLTIPAGKTLYLRIYAWNGSTSGRLLLLHNLAVSGNTTALAPSLQTAATWPLTATTTGNGSTSGNIAATAQSIGAVFPSPGYNNRQTSEGNWVSTQNITVNPGAVGTSSATAHANGGYVEFALTPQAGYEFKVENLSLLMGSGNANSVGTSIEYSLNSNFTAPVVLGTPGGSTSFPSTNVLYPFSYSPANLTIPAGQTLYVRIYAWHGSTTARLLLLHNLVISGSTSTAKATVVTTAVHNISPTTATADGNVVSDAGNTITERGFVYSTKTNPTTADTKVPAASAGTGPFTGTLTGLAPYTPYYVRAYAINSGGTAYGENISFSTPDVPDEVVSTPRQMEYLNRGVVAVRRNASSVFVSWRLLGTDPAGIAFNIYRDGVKLNEAPLTTSTNFVDNTAANGTYTVRPVINGAEGAASDQVSPWGQHYFSLPLQVPAGGTTPDGVAYTYTPNDCSVGDVDGDGEYEIFLKWDPTNAKDNSQGGYTGNVYLDCYKMNGTRLWRIDLGRNIRAGAHYTQFIVYDLDGDGKAELACKTADGTVDGAGIVIGNSVADYRNSSGYVLSGPEFLTVFNGQTGAAMATTNYLPGRGSVSSWGDSYGNRVDRFVAAVAYLDGARPSLVFGRGYYTRLVRAAWDWRDGKLTHRWTFDSNDTGNGAYAAQGNHQMTVGDVDGDGKDEVFNGSSAINDNGRRFWSSGMGHGDALHMSDLDPDRPGKELWVCLEDDSEYEGKGLRLKDAKTGETIWGVPTTGDVGRAMAADVDPRYPGAEMWGSSGGLYTNKGEQISTNKPTINFGIWWDGDLSRELLDAGYNSTTGNSTVRLEKWNPATNSSQRLLTPSLAENGSGQTNNGSKATAGLTADLFGDWREEIILRSFDNKNLLIYTTTIPTEHRIPTLMHDPQYRAAVAWQNSGYNQPPHPGFFLGNGMETPSMPAIAVKDILAPAVTSITKQAPVGELTNATSVTYQVNFSENVQGVDVSAFTLAATGTAAGTVATVTAVSAATYDVTITGITGDGTLGLEVNSSNTGITDEAGNALKTGFTEGETYSIDQTAPTLTAVTFVSNNAKPALAKEGDVVTLTFTASESIETPLVTIAGLAVVPAALGNDQYSATHTFTKADAEGVVPFTIGYKDVAGNEGTMVSTTTDAATVTYDRTAPTLPSVAVTSSNANPSYAKEGDVITLDFTASETIETPVVTIAGQSVGVMEGLGNSYTATYTMTAQDDEGSIDFTIDFSDPSGNAGIQVTEVTTTSNSRIATFMASASVEGSIIYDRTSPSIASAGVDKPMLLVPNHKMEDITVNYAVTDSNYESVVLKVTSNEPQNGLGDGDMDVDWEIVNEHLVRLRAERSGTGTGRVYTITIKATDKAGNVSTQSVKVTVPSNQKDQNTATPVATKDAMMLKIWAYPNPAISTQHFTLDIQSSNTTQLSLTVVDMTGRVIETRSGIAANSSIEIGQNYQPGVYFVQVVQGTDKVVLKLVKKP